MKFRCAEPSDNDALCKVARSISMPGSVSVCYTREPDFFKGTSLSGDTNDIICGFDEDVLMGYSVRSTQKLFINGEVHRFGYISSLKCIEKYRNSVAFGLGIRAIKKIHRADPVPGYLYSVVAGNSEQQELFKSKRAGLPSMTALGVWNSYAVFMSKKKQYSYKLEEAMSVDWAKEHETEEVVSFINKNSKDLQCAPVIDVHWFDGSRSLTISDVLILRKSGEIIATVAKWDVSTIKQEVITSYSRVIKLARPMVQIVGKITGYNPLPKEGESLHLFFASLFRCKDGFEQYKQALLFELYNRTATQGYHSFIFGVDAKSEDVHLMKDFKKLTYVSDIATAHWDNGEAFCSAIDRTAQFQLETVQL